MRGEMCWCRSCLFLSEIDGRRRGRGCHGIAATLTRLETRDCGKLPRRRETLGCYLDDRVHMVSGQSVGRHPGNPWAAIESNKHPNALMRDDNHVCLFFYFSFSFGPPPRISFLQGCPAPPTLHPGVTVRVREATRLVTRYGCSVFLLKVIPPIPLDVQLDPRSRHCAARAREIHRRGPECFSEGYNSLQRLLCWGLSLVLPLPRLLLASLASG